MDQIIGIWEWITNNIQAPVLWAIGLAIIPSLYQHLILFPGQKKWQERKFYLQHRLDCINIFIENNYERINEYDEILKSEFTGDDLDHMWEDLFEKFVKDMRKYGPFVGWHTLKNPEPRRSNKDVHKRISIVHNNISKIRVLLIDQDQRESYTTYNETVNGFHEALQELNLSLIDELLPKSKKQISIDDTLWFHFKNRFDYIKKIYKGNDDSKWRLILKEILFSYKVINQSLGKSFLRSLKDSLLSIARGVFDFLLRIYDIISSIFPLAVVIYLMLLILLSIF